MRTLFLLAMCLVAGPANAADWRYCLAQDEAGHKVYVSEPFLSDKQIELLERSFNGWLNANEIDHAWGICPRSVSPYGVADDVKSALNYNRGLGLAVVVVQWRPE